MSILQAISETVRETLQTGLRTAGSGLPASGTRVVLGSPTTVVREATSDTLTVYLFRVEMETTAQNRLERAPGARSSGLPVRLLFLITPFALNLQNDSLLLGVAMQVLHESPIVPFSGAPGRDLHINFSPLSVSEMAALWQALAVPYRLSATYQVFLS